MDTSVCSNRYGSSQLQVQVEYILLPTGIVMVIGYRHSTYIHCTCAKVQNCMQVQTVIVVVDKSLAVPRCYLVCFSGSIPCKAADPITLSAREEPSRNRTMLGKRRAHGHQGGNTNFRKLSTVLP